MPLATLAVPLVLALLAAAAGRTLAARVRARRPGWSKVPPLPRWVTASIACRELLARREGRALARAAVTAASDWTGWRFAMRPGQEVHLSQPPLPFPGAPGVLARDTWRDDWNMLAGPGVLHHPFATPGQCPGCRLASIAADHITVAGGGDLASLSDPGLGEIMAACRAASLTPDTARAGIRWVWDAGYQPPGEGSLAVTGADRARWRAELAAADQYVAAIPAEPLGPDEPDGWGGAGSAYTAGWGASDLSADPCGAPGPAVPRRKVRS
jgi:hypothetical protein